MFVQIICKRILRWRPTQDQNRNMSQSKNKNCFRGGANSKQNASSKFFNPGFVKIHLRPSFSANLPRTNSSRLRKYCGSSHCHIRFKNYQSDVNLPVPHKHWPGGEMFVLNSIIFGQGFRRIFHGRIQKVRFFGYLAADFGAPRHSG